ncbi:MAG: SDR family oxidoreductase [Rhodospirillaceae bacterium]|nr:SDR family oxidoreductase [Rhodospirillaceae bacterium]
MNRRDVIAMAAAVTAATEAPKTAFAAEGGLPNYVHPSLKDRVVIITGGGRGFGWSMAEALLKAGAKVALTASRNPDQLADVQTRADAIAGKGRCITLQADVTKWQDCQSTVAATLKAFGKIDVLINNAGRGSTEYRTEAGGRRPMFYEIPAEAFATIIETNLIGVFFMTKAVMGHFIERKRGKVFSISTSLTTMIGQGLSPYGASKAGLELTHRVWAEEMKGSGVDINILLPGGASDTSFIPESSVAGEIGSRAKEGGLLPGDVVVPPAVWLCSDATNGQTGQRIIAKFWDHSLPGEAALAKCIQPHNPVPGIM